MTLQTDWQALVERVKTETGHIHLRDTERAGILWAEGQVGQALALQDLHMETQGRNCEYHWLRTKFAGTCLKCGRAIAKHDLCVWVTKGGGTLCALCGREMNLQQR